MRSGPTKKDTNMDSEKKAKATKMMDLMVIMEVPFYAPFNSRSFTMIPYGTNSHENSIIILQKDSIIKLSLKEQVVLGSEISEILLMLLV